MSPSPSPKPPVSLHKVTRVKCLCTFPEKKKKKQLLSWVEFIYPMRIFNIMNYFHHITYFLLVSSYSFIYCLTLWKYWGFPGNSAGKESTCNAGDPSLIPQSGRSAGEGIGYLLQYSWASLVTHMVKNPPAKQETQFCSLGWEDPLEKGTATHSSILRELSVFWRIPWTVWTVGSQRVGHGWVTFTFTWEY